MLNAIIRTASLGIRGVQGSHAVQDQCPLGFLQCHFRGIANPENVIPLLRPLFLGKKLIPKPLREVCQDENLLLGQSVAADDLMQALREGLLLIDHAARLLLKKVADAVRGNMTEDLVQFICRFLFQGVSPFTKNMI